MARNSYSARILGSRKRDLKAGHLPDPNRPDEVEYFDNWGPASIVSQFFRDHPTMPRSRGRPSAPKQPRPNREDNSYRPRETLPRHRRSPSRSPWRRRLDDSSRRDRSPLRQRSSMRRPYEGFGDPRSFGQGSPRRRCSPGSPRRDRSPLRQRSAPRRSQEEFGGSQSFRQPSPRRKRSPGPSRRDRSHSRQRSPLQRRFRSRERHRSRTPSRGTPHKSIRSADAQSVVQISQVKDRSIAFPTPKTPTVLGKRAVASESENGSSGRPGSDTSTAVEDDVPETGARRCASSAGLPVEKSCNISSSMQAFLQDAKILRKSFWPEKLTELEEADVIAQCSLVALATDRGDLAELSDPAFIHEVQLMSCCFKDQIVQPDENDLKSLALRNWFLSEYYPDKFRRPLTDKSFGEFPVIGFQGESERVPSELKDLAESRRFKQRLVFDVSVRGGKFITVHSQPAERTNASLEEPSDAVSGSGFRSVHNAEFDRQITTTDQVIRSESVEKCGAAGQTERFRTPTLGDGESKPQNLRQSSKVLVGHDTVVLEDRAEEYALGAQLEEDAQDFIASNPKSEGDSDSGFLLLSDGQLFVDDDEAPTGEKASQPPTAEEADAARIAYNRAEGVRELQLNSARFLEVVERIQNPGDNFLPDFTEVVRDVVEYYIEKSIEKLECTREELPLRDVLAVRPPDDRAEDGDLPAFADVLDVEPKKHGEMWIADPFIAFLLRDIASQPLLPGHFLECDPAMLHMFVNMEVEDDVRETFLQQARDSIVKELAAGKTPEMPGASLPSSCTNWHIVYNPTGNHWVHARFSVDKRTRTGKIVVHNSLRGTKGATRKRTIVDLPWLAKLASLRPDLGWQDIHWREPVVFERCAQQSNADDCGLFACDTAQRFASGQTLYLLNSTTARLEYGKRLRWRALEKLARRITGKSYIEPTFADADETPSTGGNNQIPPLQLPSYFESTFAGVNESLPTGDGQISPLQPPSVLPWFGAHLGHNCRTIMVDAIRAGGGSASRLNILERVEEHLNGDISSEDVRYFVDNSLSHGGEFARQNPLQAIAFDPEQAPSADHPLMPFILSQLGAAELDSDAPRDEWTVAGTFPAGVDSTTVEALMQACDVTEPVADPFGESFALTIPVVRHSGRYTRNGQDAVNIERTKEILVAYHSRFSSVESLPTRVENNGELLTSVLNDTPAWTPCIREPGSSRREIFEGDRDGVVAMLALLDAQAKRANAKKLVLILFTGWDGVTTESKSWTRLVARFPWLKFRLTAAVALDSHPNPEYGQLDGDWELVWTHYDVQYLAKLLTVLEHERFHWCPRTIVDHAIEHSEEIGCQDCRTHGLGSRHAPWLLLNGTNGALSKQAVQELYSHAHFLLITQMINSWKLEHSVSHGRQGLISSFHPMTKNFVGGLGRNKFELPLISVRRCKKCHMPAGDNACRDRRTQLELLCAPCAEVEEDEDEGDENQGHGQGQNQDRAQDALSRRRTPSNWGRVSDIIWLHENVHTRGLRGVESYNQECVPTRTNKRRAELKPYKKPVWRCLNCQSVELFRPRQVLRHFRDVHGLSIPENLAA